MTKNQSKSIEEQISEIKAKLTTSSRSERGRLRRVPRDLQKEVVQFLKASNLTCSAVAKLIGVDPKSVRNWRDSPQDVLVKAKKKSRAKKRGFKQLRITPDKAAMLNEVNLARKYAMELVGGARVTGLSLEDIAKLIQSAGGAQ
jgi:transposase-like protein